MGRTWRFSKLEFRISVSMRALLYGKFIEAYKYIAYCSYVLTCKIWINVLLEKDPFAAISVALQMWLFLTLFHAEWWLVKLFVTSSRVCISSERLYFCSKCKQTLTDLFYCFSKRCANRETFSTQRFLRCLILWGEKGLHNVQLYIQLLPISRFV